MGCDRSVLGIETDERGAEHRRCVETDEDGAGRSGVHPVGHAGVEGGVGRVEDAAAEDHLDHLVLEVEPNDGSPHERRDLVGQGVGRLAGRSVALGRGVEEDAGQFEEPVVRERPGVDAGEGRLGVGQAQLCRHPLLQGGRWSTPVARPQGEAECTDAEPGAAGGEVAGQLGQGGKAHAPPVGPDSGAVHACPADDPDAPMRGRACP